MLDFILYSTIHVGLAVMIIYSLSSDGLHRYVVTFEDGKLLLDKKISIATFRQGSLNYHVMEYLERNRGREIPFSELESNVFKGRNVAVCKILDSLGIKGDFRRTMFTLTAQSIMYHPELVNSPPQI
ncbi:TPA: hypothetical protein ACOEF8_004110 [Enterobacter roggenkampii]